MTKAATRAVVMSLLNPLAGASILEIGSGTGAMTVELARAAGATGCVASLEISPEAARLARTNVGRAGLSERVSVTEGRAPGDIPEAKYEAVFVGGHGEGLQLIMQRCFDLMTPGGRMILTSVTPRTTSAALEYFGALTERVGFWRIHSSSGRRAGAEWLMIGNNPVDVMWGDK
jgi:precorrin-6Y C5,15-methyltransferase (decarboxylating)